MKQPRLFFSYSSADRTPVAAVMSALKQSDVTFWEYTNLADRIPITNDLWQRLKEEIDKCEYFVCFVSKHSFEAEAGKYAKKELEYVVSRGFFEAGKIITIAFFGTPGPTNTQWSAPFDKLQEKICLTMPKKWNGKLFFESMGILCKTVGVMYKPIIDPHPRLPFHAKFSEEVYSFTTITADHIRLMVLVGEFNEAFKAGDVQRAHFLITYFIYSCEYFQPDKQIYYPRIVKAICEQRLKQFDNAIKTYQDAALIPRADESVWGGLGSVFAQKGDLEESYRYYEKALAVCPSDRNRDEQINVIVAKLAIKQKVTDSEFEFIKSVDILDLPIEGKRAVLKARGACWYQRKEYQRAAETFQEIVAEGIYDASTIAYLQGSLRGVNRFDKAVQVLENAIQDPRFVDDPDLGVLKTLLADLKQNN